MIPVVMPERVVPKLPCLRFFRKIREGFYAALTEEQNA